MKKSLSIAFSLGALASVANAQVNHFFFYDNSAPGTVTSPAGAVNTTAGAGITRLSADDVEIPAYLAGQQVTRVAFAVANLNTTAVSFRPRLRFWEANGTGTGATGINNPGSYFGSLATHGQVNTLGIGYTFAPINFNAGQGQYLLGDVSGGGFVLPPAAVSKIWMGLTFDNGTSATSTGNVSSTATVADLNNIAIYVGSPAGPARSTNTLWTSTSPGSFFNAASPAGAQFQFTGTNPPQANYAFALAVPGQVVTGTLGLGDVSAPAYGRNIGYSVKNGTEVISSDVILFTDAFATPVSSLAYTITLPAILTGPVTIEFDGGSFLKKTFTVTPAGFVDGSVDAGATLLQNGDVDNSGEVDAADIDQVIAAFGATFTLDDPASVTDVDVSGEVDAADIDIVIANFGGVDG